MVLFAEAAGVAALWEKGTLRMLLTEWFELLFLQPECMVWKYDLPNGSPTAWMAHL
jgi:hypothetical protein